MRNARIPLTVVLALSVLWAAGPIDLAAKDEKHIAIRDDCDPDDPAWAPTGGCLNKKGDVTNAEFGLFLRSPLYNNAAAGNPPQLFLVGHPSWRNDPSHIVVEVGENIHIKNEGGRAHTFTPVAQFGGGRVPPLLVGTIPAPECALAPGATDPYLAAPGDQLKLKATTEGIQRFQCCFHPWMRATVRVEEHHHH
jgi:plastocyanin